MQIDERLIFQSSQFLQSIFNLLPFIPISLLLNFFQKIHACLSGRQEYQNLDTKVKALINKVTLTGGLPDLLMYSSNK